jgi:rubrerythrin
MTKTPVQIQQNPNDGRTGQKGRVTAVSFAEHEHDIDPISYRCRICGIDEIDLYKRRGFICPICGAVSYNLNDLLHRYCGHCHRFVDGPL